MFHYIFRSFREFIELSSKKYVIFLIIGIFFTTLIVSVEPFFLARSIGYIEQFYKTGIFDRSGFLSFLGWWLLFIGVSLSASYIHRYYLADKPALEFHNRVVFRYIENAYTMTLGEYLSKKTGSLYKNFDRGASAHFQIMFYILKDGIKTILTLFLILMILLWISPIMALLSLSMVPCMAFMSWYVAKKTRGPQSENEERWTRAFGYLGDFLSNMQLGKILRLEKEYIMRFHTELDEALEYQKHTSRWWAMSDMITSIFIMITRLLVLGYGIYAIAHGQMTLTVLMLVFSFLGMIYYPLAYIFGSLSSLQKWSVDLEKFYTEFEYVERETTTGTDIPTPLRGSIIFDGVSFGYHADRTILKDMSFHIAPGEKIALVGNTGAGKSTIISLLFRFWEVTSGKICIDDRDIREYSKASLRKHLGLVAQDNSLFNLSIRENLMFAKPDATDGAIETALKKASAEFVFTLENGIDTIIGERGLKLSGGEKQRLSIARLFLQNPEILILDEATSALDNVTEKKIQKSLDNLMKGKTTIIIAHRLSTIKHVDRIFMLENGKIIETGNYEELIALGGKFAKLADPDRLILS